MGPADLTIQLEKNEFYAKSGVDPEPSARVALLVGPRKERPRPPPQQQQQQQQHEERKPPSLSPLPPQLQSRPPTPKQQLPKPSEQHHQPGHAPQPACTAADGAVAVVVQGGTLTACGGGDSGPDRAEGADPGAGYEVVMDELKQQLQQKRPGSPRGV